MFKRSKVLLTVAASVFGFAMTVSTAVVAEPAKLSDIQSITIGNGAEPSSLDPHLSETTGDFRIQRDIFEGLVIQDDDGGILPGQAESWIISPDYKTYTFNIRDEAVWSNGDKVTATDFVNSWRRLVSPEMASPYGWYVEMTMIRNAADIINGKKAAETLGVKALDEKTLQVKLDRSIPYFLNMLTLAAMSPVHMPSIEQLERDWTQPENIVVNGAYTLQDWVVNERVTLKRNPGYWDNKNTGFDVVNFLPTNGNPELSRYKAGDVQISSGIPIEHYKALQTERPDEITFISTIGTFYYVFNTEVKPFDDVRVRQALSYAVDRDIITQKVLGQGQQPAYTFTPEVVYGFSPPVVDYQQWSQQQRDQKARELLNEAGYNESNPLKVELLYNTNDGNKRQAVVTAQMWKKIGVETTLRNLEWKTLLSTRRQGDFEVMRYTWLADYNEASTMLDVLTTGHGSNDSGYSNPDYDALMKEAKQAPSDEQRNILYAQAEKMLARDMPVLPVFHPVRFFLKAPSIGGYPMNNPQDIVYTKDLFPVNNG